MSNIKIIVKYCIILLVVFVFQINAQTVESLIEKGKTEYAEARKTQSVEAFQKAETTFSQAVTIDEKKVIALLSLGLIRLELSGLQAQKNDFSGSGETLQKAIAALDSAVKLEPNNLQVRYSRGLSYSQFPPFLNKTDIAREDLLFAIEHIEFNGLKENIKAQIHYQLGKIFVLKGETEKAKEQFLKAYQTSPESKEGKSSKSEIDKLSAPPQAFDSNGKPMPDRFPKISSDVSPIIVSASVTFPNRKGGFELNKLPASMKKMLEDMKKQDGMLGYHILSSVEHNGMLIILSWWRDKKALNNWFYSNAHQGIIQNYYGGSKKPQSQMNSGSQVGIEILTALPGGLTFGGGITPNGIKINK